MKYDLSLMDVDGRRLKKRKKWLMLSLVPIIVVFCIALKLIMPAISTHFLKMSHENGNNDAAKIWGQTNYFVNIFEPYIAYYNDGTITHAQGAYEDAEGKFNQALAENPPENRRCEIRVNLSMSIEAQADALVSAKNYDDAIVMYDRAKAALYGDDCAHPTKETGKSSEALESRKRIDEKQEEAVRTRNNDQSSGEGDDSEDGSQDQNDQPTSQSQRQDLKKRLDEALQERLNNQGRVRGQSSSDDDYSSRKKTW